MTSKYKPYRLAYKPFIYSTLIFAAVIFIPVYTDLRLLKLIVYSAISIYFIISTTRFILALLYNNTWPYHFLAYIFTGIIGLIIAVFCFVYTIVNTAFLYSDMSAIYVRKNDPHIVITSRFWNEGAWGGGTESSDFEDVISISYVPHFKLQIPVDISKIDTTKWIKNTKLP